MELWRRGRSGRICYLGLRPLDLLTFLARTVDFVYSICVLAPTADMRQRLRLAVLPKRVLAVFGR